GSCAASGASKEYIRCIAKNNNLGKKSSDSMLQYAGFRISNFDKRKKKELGNSTFIDCQSINTEKNSRLDYGFSAAENVIFKNVEIKNFKSTGHSKGVINVGKKNRLTSSIKIIE